MVLYAFLWILFVHFIADFVLQSDWMAQNKSKNWEALGIHVVVYTCTLWAGVIVLSAVIALNFIWIAFYATVNGFLHLATDAITSRINARLWAAGRTHDFFVGVGADQFIHALALGISLTYLIQG